MKDRRVFWDGEKTSYQTHGGHIVHVDSEDITQKEREWDKHYHYLQKLQLEYLKLALANEVRLDISGDISQLFMAIDKKDNRIGNKDQEEDSEYNPPRRANRKVY